MKRYVLIGLAIFTLGFAGCSGSKDVVVAAAPAQPVDPPAGVQKESVFVASGPVVVENQVDVSALREGPVVSILAEPGTQVHQGQLLAKLDDRQISADVEGAAARVRSIEANLKNWQAETKVLQSDRARAEKLYEAQVIPKEELEHVQYKEEADEYEVQREAETLNNARAVHKSLELELEKTNIVAPFEGIVARRYVRVGQKVAIGDRLFWVTAMAPLQVKFTLPERLLGDVKRGQLVAVASADISPATPHSAKVIDVSPVVDPSSGTFEVLAQIEGAASDLRPGMLATIRVNLPQ
ncbi:MAG TPA: efflux RND transporter periplasmic adaptor subunit [Terriglobales bacterium]|jgi:RND family efflux transporter MFP subunit|nr:efflux RND transporter periplasmic adaptor subunit [Terriglobales bacterium]